MRHLFVVTELACNRPHKWVTETPDIILRSHWKMSVENLQPGLRRFVTPDDLRRSLQRKRKKKNTKKRYKKRAGALTSNSNDTTPEGWGLLETNNYTTTDKHILMLISMVTRVTGGIHHHRPQRARSESGESETGKQCLGIGDWGLGVWGCTITNLHCQSPHLYSTPFVALRHSRSALKQCKEIH